MPEFSTNGHHAPEGLGRKRLVKRLTDGAKEAAWFAFGVVLGVVALFILVVVLLLSFIRGR